MTRVCLAGVTGWVGKPLSAAILESDDLKLVAAAARRARGERVGDVTISSSDVARSLSSTHRAAVDSNLVAALVMALGRALQRLLRPARSVATLGIGAAGDLTRTRFRAPGRERLAPTASHRSASQRLAPEIVTLIQAIRCASPSPAI
jgi:uncharacterized protein (UPF0261 family)